MGMAADHHIGAGIDHQPCQTALTRTGGGFPLPSPMHEGDDQVGASAAGGADVGDHLVVLAPGDPGLVGAGLERARLEFVIAEDGHAQPLPLYP